MISVGETLRRERLRRNLELERISAELKISPRFLEAIEEEKFERLPGGVFAKSFVRQYARLLGLDEEELAGEVQRTLQPQTAPSESENSTPDAAAIPLPRFEEWQGGPRRFSWSSSLPALAGVVVVMLVCSGIYALWQRSRATPVQPATAPVETARVSPPAQQPVESPPASQAPAAAPPATAPSNAAPSAVTADRSVSGEKPPAAGSNSAVPNPAAKPAAPPAGNASNANAPARTPGTAAGDANAPVRLEITATEPVWVLARADGKYLFSGTIDPSQSRTVQGSDITLRLGNAGGVNITFNGKSIGAAGPRGQVRTLQFTSGGFKIVAAPKPSLPPDDIL